MGESKEFLDAEFRNQVLEDLAVFKSKLTEIESNGRASSTDIWHEPRKDTVKVLQLHGLISLFAIVTAHAPNCLANGFLEINKANS